MIVEWSRRLSRVVARRLLRWGLVLLLILAALAAGLVHHLAREAEPGYAGALQLPGLHQAVAVTFGPHAVPTIRADDLHDLMFAQGYVVAAERLWQMDLLRRLASGRLAEFFGPGAVPADRFFRTLGLAEEANRSLADLGPDDRALLVAYAEGVNAYRDAARGRLPLEYRIAGCEPAPWRPQDSLVIGDYMAWTQSFDLRRELVFLRLAARLGSERARELFPADAGIPAPEVPSDLVQYLSAQGPVLGAAAADRLERLANLPAEFGLPVPTAASNAWAVTGPRTRDGQSMLANDPHLAPSTPGIWYELELMTPGLHLAGVSLPGVPLVLIGHNADLAWGFTTAIADTQDLFVERVTADGRHVERAGAEPEPIQQRIESIQVRGGDPVQLRIEHTRHGVVLNPILGPLTGSELDLPAETTADRLVLRQTRDLPDRSFAAMRGLARSRTLDEARAAGLGFRQVVLNLMLAHRDGGIAWQVTGLLPRRGKSSGAFPAPGWLPEYDWQGLLPQTLNPTLTNPPGAALVTANNRTQPRDDPNPIGHAWMAPYRAQRIIERLDQSPPLTPESMAAIQSDRLSLQARLTQGALRRIQSELSRVDPGAWQIAATRLLDWDDRMTGDSRSAAFFVLLEPALYRALYADELGPDLAALMAISAVAYNPLQEMLRSGHSSFWDDITTPAREGPADIWARAIRAAADEQDGRGGSRSVLTLGHLRTLVFPHAFKRLPLLGRFFGVGPIPLGGNADTIDVAKASTLAPGQVQIVPSMRMVATPADWSQTRGTLPLGQSGHRFSPYRTDQLDDWRAGRTHTWPWNGPAADQVLGRLRLRPATDPLQDEDG